jgi:hypothetical protein
MIEKGRDHRIMLFIGSMLLVYVVTVLGGLESIARCAQLSCR